uniref:hypothetical protein n=1 Tax=Candidatus Ichthyocystis hellenicum TaxID=1561003 RepID=UPI001584ACB6
STLGAGAAAYLSGLSGRESSRPRKHGRNDRPALGRTESELGRAVPLRRPDQAQPHHAHGAEEHHHHRRRKPDPMGKGISDEDIAGSLVEKLGYSKDKIMVAGAAAHGDKKGEPDARRPVRRKDRTPPRPEVTDATGKDKSKDEKSGKSDKKDKPKKKKFSGIKKMFGAKK